ncbi:helix-turn-helix transcriptional regulator [Kushneria indalinina]|uniref:LuxR family transcriptional regulator n=1 Tax=Kushneria indalinina DSM 14324 TaxID=1122140 RepID=A0A3D9DVL4_9GAMM|nr:PAS domain-containing protein [Kushneria indalinina]REC94802.1 LuxR family transcriptional regulator [Kushneria indalinina DSM 14324]
MSDSPLACATRPSPLYALLEEMREGVILLGPDGTLCWANQAALAMHNAHDIESLGLDIAEYRQRFQLRFRPPDIEDDSLVPALLAGTPFDEIGVEIMLPGPEEVLRVHSIRGRVLSSDDGAHLAALLIEDITELVSAEDRFEKSFNTNPAPALICRLRDQCFIRVNQGFLDMTALEEDDVLGRTLHDLDVFAGADQRDQALRRLDEGLMIAQMEAVLHPGATGESKCVVVAGQPIEVNQDACMLLTFTDLEPIRRAQTALRRSENQFSTLFHMSPVPTALADCRTLSLIEVNEAFNTTLGDAAGAFTTGRLEEHVLLTSPIRQCILAALEAGNALSGFESSVTNQRGERLTCLISATLVQIDEHDRVLLTLVDITERKRSEAELFAAIDTVMQDASWFTRTLVEKLTSVRHASGPDPAPMPPAVSLSLREHDVLALLCQGLSDKRIAAELALAHSTVRNYVASLYRKLDVHSRSEAIIVARQQGLDGRPDAEKRS